MSKKQPRLSIVIPCYNAGRYIANMLQSIVDQDMSDEIEVILSDDCSPEPFDKEVEPFLDKLNIKRTRTKQNKCPGNTRQTGADIATGEWMCFADQDDTFVPGTLKEVFKAIDESGESYFVLTDFDEMNVDGTLKRHNDRTMGWTHGKFFNRENLWIKYNLSYDRDLFSHEDVYMISNVNCVLKLIGRMPTYVPITTYRWLNNPDSVSRNNYNTLDGGKHQFLEVCLRDYIASTGLVYYDAPLKYNAGNNPEYVGYCRNSCFDVFAYCYFYEMSFMFRDPEGYIKSNLNVIQNYLAGVKQRFQCKNEDFMEYYSFQGARAYLATLNGSHIATGGLYVPCMTIHQFLDYLHPDSIELNCWQYLRHPDYNLVNPENQAGHIVEPWNESQNAKPEESKPEDEKPAAEKEEKKEPEKKKSK